MIQNEARHLAAVALGRALIAAAAQQPLPYRLGESDRDGAGVSGEWLGRMIGLGLLEGGYAEGFNLHGIVFGFGQAIGESCGGEDRLMLEVVVEDLERGVAHGAGFEWKERPPPPR